MRHASNTPPVVEVAVKLVNFTSVVKVMVTETVDVLFVVTGSFCVAVTVAVLLTMAGTPATTLIVKVTVAFAASVAVVQVTVRVAVTNVHPVLAELNVMPVGRTSVATTVVAAEGPLL